MLFKKKKKEVQNVVKGIPAFSSESAHFVNNSEEYDDFLLDEEHSPVFKSSENIDDLYDVFSLMEDDDKDFALKPEIEWPVVIKEKISLRESELEESDKKMLALTEKYNKYYKLYQERKLDNHISSHEADDDFALPDLDSVEEYDESETFRENSNEAFFALESIEQENYLLFHDLLELYKEAVSVINADSDSAEELVKYINNFYNERINYKYIAFVTPEEENLASQEQEKELHEITKVLVELKEHPEDVESIPNVSEEIINDIEPYIFNELMRELGVNPFGKN